MMCYKDFCKKNSAKLKNNTDAEAVFDFLCNPKNINNMIVISNLGLPAISGIVKEIENKFGNAPAFPMTNFTNRQIVGRMVKYILEKFGYEPVAKGLDERAKLRDFTGAKLFKTASVYAQTKQPVYSLNIQIVSE